jgi:hypothetical protein
MGGDQEWRFQINQLRPDDFFTFLKQGMSALARCAATEAGSGQWLLWAESDKDAGARKNH